VDIVLASVGSYRGCYTSRQNRRLDRPKVGHHPDSRAVRYILAHPGHNQECHQHICREIYRRNRCRGGVRPGACLHRRDCSGIDSGCLGGFLPSALLLGDSLLVRGGCLLLLHDFQHRLLRHPAALRPRSALFAGIANVVDATGPRRPSRQSSIDPTRISLRHRRGTSRSQR